MRNKLQGVLSALVLGWLSLPAWAQLPQPMPTDPKLPPPLLGGPPKESPPPTVGNGIFPDAPGMADACCNNGCQNDWWSGILSTVTTGWNANVGAYYMMPYFSSNPAFFRSAGGTIHEQDYTTQLTVAPTVALSYSFDKDWSIKARWWQINTNGSAYATGGGATVLDAGGNGNGTGAGLTKGATAGASSNLYLSVYNLELAHKWTFGCNGWFELSGGLAYVHMSQSSDLNVYDTANGNFFSNANHNFNGFGPTVAIEGHYRILDSDFGVYGSARGTLLVGSNDQNYYASSAVAAGGNVIGSSSSTSVLPVGEFEVGGEWSHCFCNRFRIYGQLGFVGQVWFNAGDAAQGANLSGTSLGAQVNSPANFGFIGGVGRIGIEF